VKGISGLGVFGVISPTKYCGIAESGVVKATKYEIKQSKRRSREWAGRLKGAADVSSQEWEKRCLGVPVGLEKGGVVVV
jgi:hypothetical protein